MKQKKLVIQACICLAILAAVQSGIKTEDDELGKVLEDIAEAIHENYTLAEILNLTEDAAATIASAPAAVSEAVISASEISQYGQPLDADSEDAVKQVYAVAGGRVLKSGCRDDIGIYVTVEHLSKISTYGHLSNVRVAQGDRIKKGDLLGSYDSQCGHDFYYSLEDKN